MLNERVVSLVAGEVLAPSWPAPPLRPAGCRFVISSAAARTLGWSDAFFPFPDGLLAAADAGATCAIQPGGSVKDADVIAAADARGMAMVFTGMRHFKH